jgi:hypothetical protein
MILLIRVKFAGNFQADRIWEIHVFDACHGFMDGIRMLRAKNAKTAKAYMDSFFAERG